MRNEMRRVEGLWRGTCRVSRIVIDATRNSPGVCRLATDCEPDWSFQNGAVHVMVRRLPTTREAVRAASALLSGVERQRANRFAFDRDRHRFIVARALLRRLLGARLGTRPEAVELVYGRHGKPALAPGHAPADLRFNLSHSEDLAAYAFAHGREIGVDVEAVRSMCDADAIAARFFSARENQTYLSLDSRDRPRGFFHCWTRKEAFIKALGDGLSCPLDRFDVSLAPGEPARILRLARAPGDGRRWRMESFAPAAGFVAALVAEDS